MLKKFSYVFIAIVLSLVLFSCAGETGDTGAAGPTGGSGVSGLVMNFQQGAYPSASYAGVEDTRMWSGTQQDSNYGSTTLLQVGVNSDGEAKRSLIKFDISDKLTGVVVEAAYLTIYVETVYSGTPIFALYKMTRAWVELEATWNIYETGNSWSTPGGEFVLASVSDQNTMDSVGFYTFEINAAVVQAWIDDEPSNYGLLLKRTVESGEEEMRFTASEHTTVVNRPRLTVYYTAP